MILVIIWSLFTEVIYYSVKFFVLDLDDRSYIKILANIINNVSITLSCDGMDC